MTFISYAQNFEDVMLWRALKHVDKGFYVDVGANDPVVDSVTLAFYERGWRGINIEPMRQYYDRLCMNRPADINLPVAVGESEGELTFFDVPDTGLSTVDPAIGAQHAAAGHKVDRQQVRVTTLTEICKEHVQGPIHFLKIDVEGFEKAVLRGMDFQRWRPWILVIEATRPQSQITNHGEWESMVLGAGYRFSYFDGLNHYYITEDHLDLMQAFKIPPNVFDDFCLRSGHAYSYPLTEFEARAHQAETRAHQAETRAHQAEQRVQRADALTLQEKTRAEQAEARAQETEVRARQEENRLNAHIAAINVQLAAMYASTSWRITAPMRWVGRLTIIRKIRARRAMASPRIFVKQCVLGLARHAVPAVKRNPALMKLALYLHKRFPVAWERAIRYLKPAPSNNMGNKPEAVVITITTDPPYAWSDASAADHFKTLLSDELQQRKNKKADKK